MTLLLALLLAMGLPQVETNVTGSGKQDVLRCHVCERENNFNCAGPTNCSDRETYCSFAVVRTYNVRCHDCWAINTFRCANVRICPYHVRRCLTVSIRLNLRELLIYKNCTNNCTFVYAAEIPAEAPRRFKTNSFYYVLCCSGMTCNEGGPSDIERDIGPPATIEEVLEGTTSPQESSKNILPL
uniref:UPAR/Ly6 domain-containing protein n=1 Tax=Equus asinus TaxID=9793 RepID=A0A9L0J0W8_EQUAS|nr:glycosyl-phosphatidylinositol-anchored molecule-like protein isoform X1 [Equus asinus]